MRAAPAGRVAPIARPTHFELVLNLRAARAVGQTIPQSLLLRADRAID